MQSPSETHFKNKKEFELWPRTVPPILIDHSKSHQAFDLKGIWAIKVHHLHLKDEGFAAQRSSVSNIP